MLSFLWGSARDTVGGGIAAATFLKSRDLHTSVSRSSVKQTLQSDAQQQHVERCVGRIYLKGFISIRKGSRGPKRAVHPIESSNDPNLIGSVPRSPRISLPELRSIYVNIGCLE